jgi:hypothetical protein
VSVRIPAVFAAIHFGFAWGFWKEVAKQVRDYWLKGRTDARKLPA